MQEQNNEESIIHLSRNTNSWAFFNFLIPYAYHQMDVQKEHGNRVVDTVLKKTWMAWNICQSVSVCAVLAGI